jgi:hypothetical protein
MSPGFPVEFSKKKDKAKYADPATTIANADFLPDLPPRVSTDSGPDPIPTLNSSQFQDLHGIKSQGRFSLTTHPLASTRERDVALVYLQGVYECNGIKHNVVRVKHPKTNGKIERLYGGVERRIQNSDQSMKL